MPKRPYPQSSSTESNSRHSNQLPPRQILSKFRSRQRLKSTSTKSHPKLRSQHASFQHLPPILRLPHSSTTMAFYLDPLCKGFSLYRQSLQNKRLALHG